MINAPQFNLLSECIFSSRALAVFSLAWSGFTRGPDRVCVLFVLPRSRSAAAQTHITHSLGHCHFLFICITTNNPNVLVCFVHSICLLYTIYQRWLSAFSSKLSLLIPPLTVGVCRCLDDTIVMCHHFQKKLMFFPPPKREHQERNVRTSTNMAALAHNTSLTHNNLYPGCLK